MVGRRSTPHITKRSLRNEGKSDKRPRRSVPAKVMDDTVGMSRREEQELNKALYASLQTSRRSHSLPNISSTSGLPIRNGSSPSIKPCGEIRKKMNSLSRSPVLKKTRHSLGSLKSRRPVSNLKPLVTAKKVSPKRIIKRTGSQRSGSVSQALSKFVSPVQSLSIDETSQDSTRSSSSSANESKRKIHAQRKFAQGCSLPGTPTSTPAKSVNTPLKLFPSHMPKTEDFLTFLCLRGTPLLPPHLDFFNFSRDELHSREGVSRSSSIVGGSKSKRARESTPDSSSSSGANEEVAQTAGVATPTHQKKKH